MALRVLAILNAHARRVGEARSAVSEAMTASGYDATIVESESCEHLGALVAEHAASVDVIAVCGGDGTLVSSVGPLLKADKPLAIFPLGTINELARSLSIPLDLGEACKLIASGDHRKIDIGCVNDQYFLNEASLGLSARVAKLQHDETLKKRFGMLAVPITTLRALPWLQPFHVNVRTANGEQKRMRTVQVTVANNAHFGALVQDSERHIDDGDIALYSISLRNWWQAARIVASVFSRHFPNAPGVRRLRSTSFDVETRKPRHIYADGEYVTKTPARFSVLPRALTVIVPPAAQAMFLQPADVDETAHA
jgi:YegS/Rv2252/BmrU family lipid kinase